MSSPGRVSQEGMQDVWRLLFDRPGDPPPPPARSRSPSPRQRARCAPAATSTQPLELDEPVEFFRGPRDEAILFEPLDPWDPIDTDADWEDDLAVDLQPPDEDDLHAADVAIAEIQQDVAIAEIDLESVGFETYRRNECIQRWYRFLDEAEAQRQILPQRQIHGEDEFVRDARPASASEGGALSPFGWA